MKIVAANMKGPRIAGATLSLLAVTAWVGSVLAQQPPGSASPPPPPSSASGNGYSGPNVAVLGTGFLTLALAYVPAGVVAATSQNQADGNLGYPVVGPWIDIGSRSACGSGSVPCGVEAGNIALLVVDGVAQAWGLCAMVAGFFVPTHSSTTAAVRIAPTRVGAGGYGVAALASF